MFDMFCTHHQDDPSSRPNCFSSAAPCVAMVLVGYLTPYTNGMILAHERPQDPLDSYEISLNEHLPQTLLPWFQQNVYVFLHNFGSNTESFEGDSLAPFPPTTHFDKSIASKLYPKQAYKDCIPHSNHSNSSWFCSMEFPKKIYLHKFCANPRFLC